MPPSQTPTADLTAMRLQWLAHGFRVDEMARWTNAGWDDPADAARWRRVSSAAPSELRRMRRDGYRPDQLSQAARFSQSFPAAWASALAGPDTDDVTTLDLTIGSIELPE